jgi:hypothetical protein
MTSGQAVKDCFFTNALMGSMRTSSNIGSTAGHEDRDFGITASGSFKPRSTVSARD